MSFDFVQTAHAIGLADIRESASSLLSNFGPIILVVIVFYFLLIRPQQKRVKEHKEMVSSLEKGAVVVFGGGLIGSVVKVDDPVVLSVEIAPDVKVKVRRDAVTETVQSESIKNMVKANNAAPAVAKVEKKAKKSSGA